MPVNTMRFAVLAAFSLVLGACELQPADDGYDTVDDSITATTLGEAAAQSGRSCRWPADRGSRCRAGEHP